MSQIAERTGIGRATVYKYFPDVDSILPAWHERQISGDLAHLLQVRDQAGDVVTRLEAALQAYALMYREASRHSDNALTAFLHCGDQAVRAQRQLCEMIRDLLTEGARAEAFRDDVPPDHLATFCLHAVAAACEVPSGDAAASCSR